MSVKPRPTRYDDETYIAAGRQFMHHLGEPRSDDQECLRIGSALAERGAFKQAVALSELTFDIDDDLLRNLLDQDFCDDAHEQRVLEWIRDSHIQPQRKLNDKVRFAYRDEKVAGEIVGIDTERGRYTVYVEALGHVKSGHGTLGIVVDFETIHPLARPSSDFSLEA